MESSSKYNAASIVCMAFSYLPSLHVPLATRWIDGTLPQYYNGAPSFADDNTESLDCVKFASDGWTVHSEGCGIGKLPFICEAKC